MADDTEELSDTNGRVPPYYDREFIDKELSPARIEAQGRLLLYRALNIGRAIAFIGSGISSAYGRPRWSDLIDEVGMRSEQVAASSDASLDLRSVANSVKDSKDQPLRAQVYRNLATLAQGPQREDYVQRLVKCLTRDDSFTAYSAWQPLLGEFADDERNYFPSKHIGVLNFDPRWHIADTLDNIEKLIEDARKSAKGPLRDAWTKFAGAFTARTTAAKVPASGSSRASAEERFLIYLAAASMPNRKLAESAGAIKAAVSEAVLNKGTSKEKEGAPRHRADARRGRSFDPVRTILEDLRLRRLLTTNYDFELELGLERLGFTSTLRPPTENRAPEGTAFVAERPLGDLARSTVLKEETAADLIAFAARAQANYEYEIFHLHGRSVDDETEGLVITERNYQDVYLQNSPKAHVMDEAMTAAMGGNPIIFFGMGMSEPDVLRPLRRFVAGPHAQPNRSIIAVLPADKAASERTIESLQLYLSYGVHAIYYGGERADIKRCESRKSASPWRKGCQPQSEPRLYLCIKRIQAIKDIVKVGSTELRDLAMWVRAGNDPFDVVKEMLEASAAGTPCCLAAAVDVATAIIAKDYEEIVASNERCSNLGHFLYHLEGRIRTRALCMALNDISEKRRAWWRNWREPPKVRTYKPLVEYLRPGEGAIRPTWKPLDDREYRPFLRSDQGQPIRAVRYSVLTRKPISQSENAAAKKDVRADFCIDARGELDLSDTVADAVQAITRQPSAGGSRRIFVVHGARGAGRGEFFHALASNFADVSPDKLKANYQWAFFTNATFSSEYSSVIDGLNYFLWRCSQPLTDPPNGVRKPRGEALRNHLRNLYSGGGAGDAKRRGLIVLGGADLLFRTKDGSAKNFEIVRALEALLEQSQGSHPIDVVIGCRTDKCAAIFGSAIDVRPPKGEVPLTGLRFGAFHRKLKQDSFNATFLELAAPSVEARVTKGLSAYFGVETTARDMFKDVSEPLQKRFAKERPDDWRQAMQSRFASSIVVDCAIETYRRAAEDATQENRKDAAALATHRFLVSVGDTRSRAADRRGADLAIAAVLAQYERLDHHHKRARKFGVDISTALCTLLLKHLAIISGPVELIVLTRCPEVSVHLADPKNGYKDVDSESVLRAHLEWLHEHSLVFSIQERAELIRESCEPIEGDDRSEHWFRRYVAHQSVQGYFFHRIGSHHRELGDSRLFTVSTYASQSRDLPTPSHDTYEFLTNLVRELIQYPDGERTEPSKAEFDRRADACALRAAVSLSRSAFSLAVVSRYSEYGDLKRPFGYLEEYRLLLRWMIWRAGMIGIRDVENEKERAKIHESNLREAAKILPKRAGERVEKRFQEFSDKRLYRRFRFNALYQDEVTWLYNECALVSYAQGNLHDAMALFERASHSNKLVEFLNDEGPNALRIALNRALCEIDRGNVDEANNTLRRIWHRRRQEPAVAAIARGYMGLVAHLKRRIDQAVAYYEEAIRRLRKYGESRALSIIQRHYGDLERARDQRNSKALLRAALAEAETAGQHDLVHRINVSLVRAELEEGPSAASDAKRMLQRLDDVLRYAGQMEIYSLRVDATLARAIVISRQGESRTAGEQAVGALSLASLYGQNLRAVFAMSLLGSLIAQRRDYRKQGLRLLSAARKMAEAYNYQPARETIYEQIVALGDTT